MDKKTIILSVIFGLVLASVLVVLLLLGFDAMIITFFFMGTFFLINSILNLAANKFKVIRCNTKCEAKLVKIEESKVFRSTRKRYYEFIVNGQKLTITDEDPIEQEGANIGDNQIIYVCPKTNEYLIEQKRNTFIKQIILSLFLGLAMISNGIFLLAKP